MAQEQKRKGKQTDEQPTEATEVAKKDEELAAQTDDILDEIDDVLETNAEDFVKNYIQKGGE